MSYVTRTLTYFAFSSNTETTSHPADPLYTFFFQDEGTTCNCFLSGCATANEYRNVCMCVLDSASGFPAVILCHHFCVCGVGV